MARGVAAHAVVVLVLLIAAQQMVFADSDKYSRTFTYGTVDTNAYTYRAAVVDYKPVALMDGVTATELFQTNVAHYTVRHPVAAAYRVQQCELSTATYERRNS